MMKYLLLFLFISYTVAWDYLLFVQYWPPTWIKSGHILNSNFTNDHYNNHGIWPEYNNNTYPESCNKSAKFDLDVLNPIYPNLTKYWTDYRNAINFWKHEYLKHATCAENDPILADEFSYFNTGLALREKYNIYQYLSSANIIPSNKISYSTALVFNTVYKIIGYEPAITCRPNGWLDSVIVCMDKNLGLMNCPTYLNSCNHPNINYLLIKN